MTDTSPLAIRLDGVRFAWSKGTPPVLDIETLAVPAGESVFLRGPSGSGKSTLLGLVSGVLEPQAGRVEVLGQDLAGLSSAARDRLRAERMGVIFQMFNLVPYLGVVENVALGCAFSKARAKRTGGDVAEEARRLLARLGLTDPALLKRSVGALSVGQQQRVAAARALIGRPDLVIADEPTSALDTHVRDRFIELLIEETRAAGATLLFVSHDETLGGRFDRVVDLPLLNRAGQASEGAAA